MEKPSPASLAFARAFTVLALNSDQSVIVFPFAGQTMGNMTQRYSRSQDAFDEVVTTHS
jgi:hypothetical protein